MPLLVVERGSDKGASLKLDGDKPFVVGRDNPQASFSMKDALASRAHFEIRKEGGAWVLRDLKSRNGTLLNDEKIGGPAPMAVGDKVQAGDTIFSFLGDQKEEAAGGLTNKVLGGYRILDRLGRGGMGTVYKAEQISLNRVVALKVLSSKLLSDPVFVERFVAEARAAGALNHPNIVQVFDVGTDRGVHFFSMDLMENGSVGDMMTKQGPLPWKRALEMMTDAAKGLVFAERRGVVHRDIKPDNLMLTAEGTVKIGDLGLAKKAEETGEGGAIFGTPHFIAPEQAQGKPVDHRADLYALGASFYCILSGKTPFTGENVKEILVKQINDEPPPLTKIVADIPPELGAIIAKLMQKKPDDRYRSAQGLVEDLEKVRVRYHLEAHGALAGAKRTKALAAVLGLSVLGLGGVVYHFATKKPDVEYVPVEVGGNNTNNTPVPVPVVDPEEKALAAFNQADNLYLRTERRLGEPLKSWAKASEWEEALKTLDRVAAEHKGTEGGIKAGKLADRIRADLVAGEKAHRAAADAARAAITAALGKATALHDGGDLVGALQALAGEVPEAFRKHGEFLLGEDETAAKTLHDRARRALEDRAAALVTAAEAAGKAFPPVGLKGTIAANEEFVAGIDLSRLKDDDLAAVTAAIERVKSSGGAAKDTARDAVYDALASDAAAYFRGYLAIRRWAPPDGELDSPFFDFKFAEALAAWETLRKSIRTAPFLERVSGKIEHYTRCRRVFAVLVERINSKEIKDAGFPDSVRKGATNLVLDITASRQATLEGVPVLRISGGTREPRVLEWKDFTPGELWSDFLRHGADGRLPAESLWDMAVLLSEAGEGTFAAEAMGLASAATPKVELPEALRRWLHAEITAAALHENQVEKPFLEYLEEAKANASRDALEAKRKLIEDRMTALERNDEFTSTDYALLHRSLRGADGGTPNGLLLDTVVRDYVAGFGLLTVSTPPGNGGTTPGNGGSSGAGATRDAAADPTPVPTDPKDSEAPVKGESPSPPKDDTTPPSREEKEKP